MDPQFQTSFIPKKALSEDRAVSVRPVSVFVFIGTIIFIASIIGAGAVYFMQAGLVRSVAQNKDTLDKAQQAFEKDFIVELETTDRRLNDAKSVLDNHIVVSPIFAALAQSTLKSIQFTKFSYATTGTGPSAKVAVSMSGKAASYTSIALESDLLTQNKYITDPIFANLTLDDQSNVLFDLTFNVDPHFVSFGESLAQQLPATADTAGQGSAAPSPAAASSAPSDGTQAPSTSTTNQAAQ